MTFKNTIDYIYSMCAKRVSEKIADKKLKLHEIYPSDPKQISWIQNNKRTKNNRYLVSPAVLYKYDKDYGTVGIIPKLGFKNCMEVLWGTEKEIDSYLPTLFCNIMNDLLTDEIDVDIDINNLLCDYIPFAKYSAYWDILFKTENQFPAIFFGIKEDTVVKHIDNARDKAIEHLFHKCKEDFKNSYIEFASDTISFSKMDKIFVEYCTQSIIPFLKKYIPAEDSLGLRVKNLISADLSKVAKLMTTTENRGLEDIQRRLIHASTAYIDQLESIQASLIENDSKNGEIIQKTD